MEAGIDLTPAQKAEIQALFEKAKKDVRTDRIDPTLRDSSPERGLEIPESGGLPRWVAPDTAKPAPDKAGTSPNSQPSDGKTTEPAKADAAAKPSETKPSGTAAQPIEKSAEPRPDKKAEDEKREKRIVITVPDADFEPVPFGDYIYALADVFRQMLDEKQKPKFESIFERWAVLHPAGAFDGPFPRLARTIRDPLIALPKEKQQQLIKIIAVTRKDAQKDDPDAVRAKRAEDAKTKILAELTEEQRRLFLSTLAELEVDDQLAEKEKEEYKKGVVVGP
jgi:hypothetical protein